MRLGQRKKGNSCNSFHPGNYAAWDLLDQIFCEARWCSWRKMTSFEAHRAFINWQQRCSKCTANYRTIVHVCSRSVKPLLKKDCLILTSTALSLGFLGICLNLINWFSNVERNEHYSGPEMAVHMNLLRMGLFLVCFAAVAEFSLSRTKRWSHSLHDQISSRANKRERGEMHNQGHCSFRWLEVLKSWIKDSGRVFSVPLLSLIIQVDFVGVMGTFEYLNAVLKICFIF